MEGSAMKKLLIVLLLLVTIVSVVWAQVAVGRYREQALSALNAAAAADSARLYDVSSWMDSTNAYQRLVLQREIERDDLDRQLQERPVIRLPGEVVVDTLWMPPDTVFADPPVEEGRQDYEFEGVDHPFGYVGTAQIWPLETRGIFTVRVHQIEPVPIGVRVGCVEQDGVRAASVLFTADDPFNLRPGEVQQDPAICNPQVPLLQFTKGKAFWAGGGFLAGVLIAHLFDDGFRKARY